MAPNDIVERYYAIAAVAAQKPLADLTEDDKAALSLAAGVPVEWEREQRDGGTFLKFTTLRRVGFSQVDGKVRVVVEQPDTNCIRVPL